MDATALDANLQTSHNIVNHLNTFADVAQYCQSILSEIITLTITCTTKCTNLAKKNYRMTQRKQNPYKFY